MNLYNFPSEKEMQDTLVDITPIRDNLIGDMLCPADFSANLKETEWLQRYGQYGLLKDSALGMPAEIQDPSSFQTLKSGFAYWRLGAFYTMEKIGEINENMRKMQNASQGRVMWDQINEDRIALLNRGIDTKEYKIIKAFQNQFNFNYGGKSLNLDYGILTAQCTVPWSASADAKPFDDFNAIRDKFADGGGNGYEFDIYMNYKTLSKLTRIDAIKSSFVLDKITLPGGIVTINSLNTLLPGLVFHEYNFGIRQEKDDPLETLIPDDLIIAMSRSGSGGAKLAKWMVPASIQEQGNAFATDVFQMMVCNQINNTDYDNRFYKFALQLSGLPVILYPKLICLMNVGA